MIPKFPTERSRELILTVGDTAVVAMLWAPPWTSGDVCYLTAPEMQYLRYLRSLLQISGAVGVAVFIELSIYIGLFARQVEYHQATQSILCCASITTTTIPVISLPTWLGMWGRAPCRPDLSNDHSPLRAEPS
jgi:hypothetical protein